VAYKAAGNVNVDKVYDPFEILGISQVRSTTAFACARIYRDR
jgi:preprotein translocase subunit Sec63